jgi:hypothetical protein
MAAPDESARTAAGDGYHEREADSLAISQKPNLLWKF